MASESIVPRVLPEVGGLEWPRFCYAGKILFSLTYAYMQTTHKSNYTIRSVGIRRGSRGIHKETSQGCNAAGAKDLRPRHRRRRAEHPAAAQEAQGQLLGPEVLAGDFGLRAAVEDGAAERGRQLPPSADALARRVPLPGNGGADEAARLLRLRCSTAPSPLGVRLQRPHEEDGCQIPTARGEVSDRTELIYPTYLNTTLCANNVPKPK